VTRDPAPNQDDDDLTAEWTAQFAPGTAHVFETCQCQKCSPEIPGYDESYPHPDSKDGRAWRARCAARGLPDPYGEPPA